MSTKTTAPAVRLSNDYTDNLETSNTIYSTRTIGPRPNITSKPSVAILSNLPELAVTIKSKPIDKSDNFTNSSSSLSAPPRLSVTTTVSTRMPLTSLQQQQQQQKQQQLPNSSMSSASASASATGPTPPPASANSNSSAVIRRCESSDCNAVKLVSMVPKRKTSQFITSPVIMEKPMLINGFTTVFQVDGNSAKLFDLSTNIGCSSGGNSSSISGIAGNAGRGGGGGGVSGMGGSSNTDKGKQTKTIYRIVPNTHAHIVNYVVVDAEGDSLRKINEGDPATMKKLLISQKNSADQMLKKLIAGGTSSMTASSTPKAITTTVAVASTATTTTTNATVVAGVPVSEVSTGTTNSINIVGSGNNQQQQQQQYTNKNISIVSMASNDYSSNTLPALAPIIAKPTMMSVSASSSTLTSPITTTQILNSSTTTAGAAGTMIIPSLTSNQSQQSIKLPIRMHPNLKITAVSSADAVPTSTSISMPMPIPIQMPIPVTITQASSSSLASSSSSATTLQISNQQMPLITPVPLANLQNIPTVNSNSIISMPTNSLSQHFMLTQNLSPAISSPSPPLVVPIQLQPSSSSSVNSTQQQQIDVADKPVFHKMQAEIEELRRTVAYLAEAQKKNSPDTRRKPLQPPKRPRYSGTDGTSGTGSSSGQC